MSNAVLKEESPLKPQWEVIDLLQSKAEAAAVAAKEARDAFIASLPYATAEELEAVRYSVRHETDQPEGLNSSFQLSKEQKVGLKAARDERRSELARTEVRSKIMRKAGRMTLTSCKVREKKQGTSMSLRFESKKKGKAKG